ncbi:MAG: laminin G domain-containing protein [Verrucomicrobiales bacterium]|nr:laminin G domain-containing protein [Verrucomicrobiales bacterium]
MRHLSQTTRKTRRWGTAAALIAAASAPALFAADVLPVVQSLDKVASRPGVFRGARFTPDAGGRSASAGDRAVDFGASGSGPVYVQDASFLNASTATDELSVSFWTKKYDIAAGSAFWINSPSSGGARAFQAHVPWDNNNVYFDTAGCCAGDTQRINAGIDTFSGYTGDNTWWTDSWHHFVFTKQGSTKKIWIDGVLFLEGENTAPLPTDITDLYIGSDGTGTGLFHALVDDFAIFGTALSETVVKQIHGGTAPSALPAAAELLAVWEFNDAPADGQFVSISPAADSTSASPDLIQIVHIDGTTPWSAANVSLKVDGVAVTPTVTKSGLTATVAYTPATLPAAQTRHTASFTYPSEGGSKTVEWSFTIAPYTTDVVSKRVGAFRGGSSFTGGGGGRSGAAGDYSVDFGLGTGPVYVRDGAFLNAATANNELTVAFWGKKYNIAASSAFWFNSPSSNNGFRGYQAHVPWSDNTIYFDTSGCCGGDTQRISANIDTFSGYTGDVSWWTNDWHHFAFSKKGDVKQVWIDGILFLEAVNTAPLPTDFTEIFIGSDAASGNRYQGLIDDFTVFGAALGESDLTSLKNGNAPTTLPAAAKLLAFWNFNDIPPGGLFVSFSPADQATDGLPNQIKVVHLDGTTAWDLSKVSLTVDGAAVAATSTRANSRVTVAYTPNPIFAALSKHTATLTYPNPDGTLASVTWSFTVGAYTRDLVAGNVGAVKGAAVFTADAGGKTGTAGDYAIDFGRNNAGQSVHIVDASFINVATANDELSFAAWQKLHLLADSALVWAVSPSSSGGQRGFSTHAPWSNNTLYFDTAGCCAGDTQRINAGADTFSGYTGDVGFWTNWHHLVFQKKGSIKQIWIDGEVFLEGENTGALPTDFTEAFLGFDPPDNARMRGLIDDAAFFKTALTEADVKALFNGTKPNALPAAAGLIAYWNFNDPPAAPATGPTFGITRSGNKVTITSTAPLPDGYVLETAASITGPWTVQAGATTPVTVDIGAGNAFLRAVKR